MHKKLIAEAVGTFTLALAIQTSLMEGSFLPTPVIAALVVVLFVFTIGDRSGAHLNPAVTIGMWSIQKITGKEAGAYIGAQAVGAILATLLATTLWGAAGSFDILPGSFSVLIGEVIGALLFGFGIAAVVYGKVPRPVSGPVIGGSLLLGLILAVGLGSSGFLNPFVYLTLVGLEDIESGTGKFLGTKNPLTVKSSTFRFSSKHLLYGRLRPYLNKVMLPDFDGHCSTEIFPIRLSPQLNREYLFME